nr:hypothetical protein B0A51_06488 [Rachicladosporium sp. CCFEE 5018]
MARSFRRQNTSILITLSLILLATLYIKHKDNILWRKAFYYYPTRLVPAYRAPLLHCSPPYSVPGSYYVYLHHGCTIEQHNETLGEAINLDLMIKSAQHGTKQYDYAIYWARGVDDAVLAAIRGDLAVDAVECMKRPQPVSLWDPESSTWVEAEQDEIPASSD